MKKVVNFEKELFPLKKDMMKKHSFEKIDIISNHYKLKINENQKFNQWFIKIINKEDKINYEKNPNFAKDALPMDARVKREEVFSMNRKGIYKMLGDCIPTGNNLFTLKRENYEDNKYIIFDKHTKFDFILEFTKELNFTDLKGNKNSRLPILRMINSCFKQILKKKNFIEWGQNKKYYNNKVFEKLPKHNITIYKGCTFKAEILENGINITVGPTNRIIRDKNFYEAFLHEKIPKNNKDRIILKLISARHLVNKAESATVHIAEEIVVAAKLCKLSRQRRDELGETTDSSVFLLALARKKMRPNFYYNLDKMLATLVLIALNELVPKDYTCFFSSYADFQYFCAFEKFDYKVHG